MPNGDNATAIDVPNSCLTGSLPGPAAWPVCPIDRSGSCPSRATFTITPGETKTFRLINAGVLLYMTVCFAGHEVTVLNADARAVQPVVFGNGCVDVNSGQRLDVNVTANQAPGNYWISGECSGVCALWWLFVICWGGEVCRVLQGVRGMGSTFSCELGAWELLDQR